VQSWRRNRIFCWYEIIVDSLTIFCTWAQLFCARAWFFFTVDHGKVDELEKR
jgi:hypothetical protein